MKKILFVINPRSGKEKVRNHLLEILNLFSACECETEVYVTQKTKDAYQVVAERGGGKDLIVCSGGDGTLNEVVNAVMKLQHQVEIGYIPSGSTNDFAASLKLPKNIKLAAETAIHGKNYLIDVGQFCNENYFVYVAGFGAFTEVSYLTSQDIKNFLGHQAYLLEGVRRLMDIKPYQVSMHCEELELEGEFIFGMVTNTMVVGGFKGLVDQGVALNDGLFEVLMIRYPRTPLDLSTIVTSLISDHANSDFVYKFKTSHIEFEMSEPAGWVLDGEFGGNRSHVEIQNLCQRMSLKKRLK